MVYSGWIIGSKEDRTLLEQLGVKIEEETPKDGKMVEWSCTMNERVLKRLDEYWGRFYYGLHLDGEKNGHVV